MPIVPTSDDTEPLPVATIPALYVVTKANPEMVTGEDRQVVYEVSYGYAIGDAIEDVTLSAEIAPNTRFVAEESDERWVCPETNQSGDVCVLELGMLNQRDRGSVLFVLEFIYPPEETVASFETVMIIQVGDNEASRITDSTEIMVQAQSSDVRILVPLIEKN